MYDNNSTMTEEMSDCDKLPYGVVEEDVAVQSKCYSYICTDKNGDKKGKVYRRLH